MSEPTMPPCAHCGGRPAVPSTAPSDKYAAVYLDDYDELWADYPTSPPGDYILPLVWASEEVQSKRDLEANGLKLRIIGWSV